jgi:hypothetical protein
MLHSYLYIEINNSDRAVVAMIVWYLDVQLPMQSVPIAIDIVSSNLDQGQWTRLKGSYRVGYIRSIIYNIPLLDKIS